MWQVRTTVSHCEILLAWEDLLMGRGKFSLEKSGIFNFYNSLWIECKYEFLSAKIMLPLGIQKTIAKFLLHRDLYIYR